MNTIARNVIIMAARPSDKLGHLGTLTHRSILPICGKPPIIQLVEQFVRTAGTENFYVRMQQHSGLILTTLSPTSQFTTDKVPSLKIHPRVECDPLDTAEGVKKIFLSQKFRGEAIPVISCDIFAPFVDFGKMVSAHKSNYRKNKSLLATIGVATTPASEAVKRYGVVALDRFGNVKTFADKPRTLDDVLNIAKSNEYEPLNRLLNEQTEATGSTKLRDQIVPINSCIYILSPGFFDSIREPNHELGRWSFTRDIFPRLKKSAMGSFIINSCWIDVDFPEDYWRAQFLFAEVAKTSVTGELIKNWSAISSKADIDDATWADLRESVVGNNVLLRNVAADNSFIFEGSQVVNVRLRNSVVMPYTYINMRGGGITEISNSIVGGRLIGGTSIDSSSVKMTSINNKIIVPDSSGLFLSIDELAVSETDIQRARSAATLNIHTDQE